MSEEKTTPGFKPTIELRKELFGAPSDSDMSLDEWVGQLPDGHRAKSELGLIRAYMNKQNDEIFRLRQKLME